MRTRLALCASEPPSEQEQALSPPLPPPATSSTAITTRMLPCKLSRPSAVHCRLLQKLQSDKESTLHQLQRLDSRGRRLFSATCKAFRVLLALRQFRTMQDHEQALQLLRWILDQDVSGYAHNWACAFSAEAGNLPALQYARAQGCPWDWRTCCSAAKGGSMECLQWARQNGCEWNELTCEYASEAGHTDILNWARAQGCLSKSAQGTLKTEPADNSDSLSTGVSELEGPNATLPLSMLQTTR